MNYYVVEISTFMDATPESKAIYTYGTKDEAIATFHKKLGGAMSNANYASEYVSVFAKTYDNPAVNPFGSNLACEYWERPVVAVEPENIE